MANKTLAEEELDRELVVREAGYTGTDGIHRDWSVRARVSKKTLSFIDAGDRQKTITFTKRHSVQRGETLEIETRHKEIVYEKCSLGHQHQKSERQLSYEWWTIEWDHIERLIEWLQHGSWPEVSGKEKPEIKLLKDIETFLDKVLAADDVYKPHISAIKRKIRDVVRD